ncbi:hypothetical protein BC829DRAFT_89367 [Chytridium lagenaria]|nr:hypothetical protein BC829DRAFT_89367 [Chytridium lagenaria]
MQRISATQQQLASMMEDLKLVARTVAASSAPQQQQQQQQQQQLLLQQNNHHHPLTTSTSSTLTPTTSTLSSYPPLHRQLNRPASMHFPTPPHHHHHHNNDDYHHPPDMHRRLSVSSSTSLPSRYTTTLPQGGTVFVDPDDEVTMSPHTPVSPWHHRTWTPPTRSRCSTSSQLLHPILLPFLLLRHRLLHPSSSNPSSRTPTSPILNPSSNPIPSLHAPSRLPTHRRRSPGVITSCETPRRPIRPIL